MKTPALIILLVTAFALEAPAQITIRLAKDGSYRSGNYEGYWSPTYSPKGFQHELASVRIDNETRASVDVYHIDRYNSWNWAKRVAPGDSARVTAPVGDVLVVRGRHGNVLQRFVARPGRQTVEIRHAASYYGGDRYAPGNARRFDIKVRNKTGRPLVVYALQPWGSWVWAGRVSPGGGELELRTYAKQEFRVLDHRGREVKKFRADRDDRRITVDRD